jgi:hypothetical protein
MSDPSSSAGQEPFCWVEFDECNHWLRATWQGFVYPQQALQSVVSSLSLLSGSLSPLFLNDNSQVLNPWFDSLTWLRYVWESTDTPPPACVAHVMQPGGNANARDLDIGWTRNAGTELQLFESVYEAEEWLHSCQHILRPQRPT